MTFTTDFEAIVKIQRPLVTSEPEAMALIYSQDRSLEFQWPMSEVAELFGPDELKIYHRAVHRSSDGKVEILERAPDQGW